MSFVDVDDVQRAGFAPASPLAEAGALAAVRESGRHGFPFGMPVSVERSRHMALVQARRYWVTPKLNGTRVAVVFARHDTTAVAVLMDRGRRMFGVHFTAAPAVLFQGTVCDAELVQRPADGSWHVWVFDIAVLAGKPVHDPLSKRLQVLSRICGTLACPTATFACKPMAPLQDPFDDTVVRAALEGFPCDGIILTPEQEPASRPGTAASVLKVKAVHTLDLQWTDGPGGSEGGDAALWFGDAMDMVSVHKLRTVVRTQGFPPRAPSGPGVVVEVAIDSVTDKQLVLSFVSTRPSKEAPNNALCVLRTLVSAADNVTFDEVRTWCPAAVPGNCLPDPEVSGPAQGAPSEEASAAAASSARCAAP